MVVDMNIQNGNMEPGNKNEHMGYDDMDNHNDYSDDPHPSHGATPSRQLIPCEQTPQATVPAR